MANAYGQLEIAVLGQVVVGGQSVEVFPLESAGSLPVGIILTNISSIPVDIATIMSVPGPVGHEAELLATADTLAPGDSLLASGSYLIPPAGEAEHITISASIRNCIGSAPDANCPVVFNESVTLIVKSVAPGTTNPPPGTVKPPSGFVAALVIGGVLLAPVIYEWSKRGNGGY